MAEAMEVDDMGRDYTQVPKQLDEQFERPGTSRRRFLGHE